MNADERGKERIFVFQHTIEKNLYLVKTPEGEVVPPVPRNDLPEGREGTSVREAEGGILLLA